MFRKTDFYRESDYQRINDSRKKVTGRRNSEKFFPIDIVEIVLLKIGVIDKFEDFSSIKSKDLLYEELIAEYQMREKFLDLYDDLFEHVLDEFENMIVVRSGGTIVSNEKGRRRDNNIMVKRIIGYDNNNQMNLAYRRGFDSQRTVFSNLRIRSDFKKDLDHKDFIKEQINLYYVKHGFIHP